MKFPRLDPDYDDHRSPRHEAGIRCYGCEQLLPYYTRRRYCDECERERDRDDA